MWQKVGFTLAGFVAGEGSFCVSRHTPTVAGLPRVRFVFEVHVASRDRPILEALEEFLGYGSITDTPARKEGWQPESSFRISSLRGHRAATVPFCERFLLPCAKRTQYERWLGQLDAWERERPSKWGKGRSTCSAAGCDGLVRGRGLCRHHYYLATGY
jgi:hypothetical protein